ncbi:ATP-binding cassette domain-containing protein [Chitinilyticum litopenaei]|uniref:ATP-binding cassette domain-containing protein n=1 Tax=Chitinilyticum litopenaei TaxID=1121276 RepID=UPI00040912FF|nr:ATP-binding cassette domain-containing protein [Chitinilyticum litopenaei]
MLELHNAALRLGDAPLFSDLSFAVAAGEVLTLMGPSGCGKSSLLAWLLGALPPAFSATGELWLGGQRVDGLPIEARQIGILFQDDLLFPHLSVLQNLLLAMPPGPAAQRRERAGQLLAEVGLAGLAERDPATLSGGQRARAGLLRALLAEPRALLLDEPFSKLDMALRGPYRQFVFAQLAARGIPAVLVTHDPGDVPPGGRVLQLADYQESAHV